MTEPEKEQRRAAELAADAVDTARDDIKGFISDNGNMFTRFLALADVYNAAIDEAGTLVRALPGAEKIELGSFKRSAPPKKTLYKVGRLTAEILALPGVIKDVDNKVLESLVLSGHADGKVVAAAKVTEDQTPRLTAPKKILIDLSAGE